MGKPDVFLAGDKSGLQGPLNHPKDAMLSVLSSHSKFFSLQNQFVDRTDCRATHDQLSRTSCAFLSKVLDHSGASRSADLTTGLLAMILCYTTEPG